MWIYSTEQTKFASQGAKIAVYTEDAIINSNKFQNVGFQYFTEHVVFMGHRADLWNLWDVCTNMLQVRVQSLFLLIAAQNEQKSLLCDCEVRPFESAVPAGLALRVW